MANRSRNARQNKQWSSIPSLKIDMTADGNKGGSILDFAEAATVLRMIGEYILVPTGVASAADDVRIGIGIGVVSSDAAALGATALPDPIGEPEYPWLFWAVHGLYFAAATSGTAGQGPQGFGGSLRRSFDVRSMRKLKPRESLVAVVEYSDGTGTPPITIKMSNTRVLLGLH